VLATVVRSGGRTVDRPRTRGVSAAPARRARHA
jgi:hypothetical protein